MLSDMKIFKTRIKNGFNYNSFSKEELEKMKKVRLTYLYFMRRFNFKLGLLFGFFSLTLFLSFDLEIIFEIQYFAYALIGASAVFICDVIFLRNPERMYDKYILKSISRERKILEVK